MDATISLFGYIIGLLGCWTFCDGVASLYLYICEKSDGQTWLRDHSFRVIRCLVGIALMVFGALI